ncbi:MAG: thioredoxin family protein [Cytophagaceae bacterium]|nr:thioredoxin family protein [Cytophagaceae bacterium]
MKTKLNPPARLLAGLVMLLTLGAGQQPVQNAAAPLANPLGYGIGDAVANFRLKNVDGRTVSLADFKDGKGAIIVFTCNHCPFSRAYEDRVIALNQRFMSQGFPVIGINPNDPAAYEEDSFENMKVRAREKGYSFPYLADETQEVARAFGATRTPYVVVLKREGDKFTVQYMGTIDDNSQDAGSVTHRYVEDAVNNLLAGKPVGLNTTKSVGCAIKWKTV